MLIQFEVYNEKENIIKIFENIFYINNKKNWSKWFSYGFLLKDNNRIKELNKWHKELKKRIKILNEKKLLLNKKLIIFEKSYKGNNIKKDVEYNKIWEKGFNCSVGLEVLNDLLDRINK